METEPCIAWTMASKETPVLKVHLLLTGAFFAVGTKWFAEETSWYLRRVESAEAARELAVNHTSLLELQGDTVTDGPVMLMVKDQTPHLADLGEMDRESGILDYLFDSVMEASLFNSAADV